MSMNPRRDYKEEVSTALPNQVKYSQLRPQAAYGTSSIRTFQSTNETTFTPEGNPQARIEVTCGQGGFLDCANGYLNIEIEGLDAANNKRTLDGGIWSVVERLEIISGGKQIEYINNYNLLHNKLFQYNTTAGSLVKHNAVSGTAQKLRDMIAANGTATITNEAVYDPLASDFDEQGKTVKGSFTPVSGFLNGNKYVPLGSSSQGFTIQITFAQPAACLVATKTDSTADSDPTKYKAIKVQYVAPIVYIRDPSFGVNWSALMGSVGGVSWEGQTYSCLTNSLTSVNGETSININEKCKSLNGFMTVLRTADNVNNLKKPSLNESSIADLTSYRFKIGEEYYPNAAISIKCDANTNTTGIGCVYGETDISRAYMEVMKLFGNVNDHHASSLIGAAQYSSSEANGGAGIVGIDLESYQGDSNTNEKGLNTAVNGLMSSLEINANITVPVRVDTFAFKTAIYHLDATGEFSVSK